MGIIKNLRQILSQSYIWNLYHRIAYDQITGLDKLIVKLFYSDYKKILLDMEEGQKIIK